MYKSIFKRFFDFVAAFVGLVVLLPFLLVVAVFLAFANRGKIVFRQPRPGKDGEIFNVIKFKTMNDKKDSSGALLPDYERLTGIGRAIRSLSIDELLQLINVLKGDMSLVGPRPLLVEYLPLYSPEQARRHKVRPGITGWAQVNGRNAISWKQKFEYDVWYVNNLSFLLDIKILFLTVKKVVCSHGVNASSDVTMEPFKGNN